MIVAELKENGADIHPVCSHLQAVCHSGVDVQMTAASVYGGKTRFLSWLPLAAPPPTSNTTTTPAEPPPPYTQHSAVHCLGKHTLTLAEDVCSLAGFYRQIITSIQYVDLLICRIVVLSDMSVCVCVVLSIYVKKPGARGKASPQSTEL